MNAPETQVHPDPPVLVLPSAGTTLAGMVAGLLCGAAAFAISWFVCFRAAVAVATVLLGLLVLQAIPGDESTLFKTTANVTGDLSIAAIVFWRAGPGREVE